jgi:hypothetical protein
MGFCLEEFENKVTFTWMLLGNKFIVAVGVTVYTSAHMVVTGWIINPLKESHCVIDIPVFVSEIVYVDRIG